MLHIVSTSLRTPFDIAHVGQAGALCNAAFSLVSVCTRFSKLWSASSTVPVYLDLPLLASMSIDRVCPVQVSSVELLCICLLTHVGSGAAWLWCSFGVLPFEQGSVVAVVDNYAQQLEPHQQLYPAHTYHSVQ